MRNVCRLSLLFAMSMFAIHSEAQDARDPVFYLVVCTAEASIIPAVMAQRGDLDGQRPAFEKASTCLEEKLPDAVKSAQDNADLKAAVKDFYVNARRWTSTESVDRAVRHDYELAQERLIMEATAAGKWPKR